MIKAYHRSGALVAVAAAAAIGLAACGGSNPSHVASLGNSSNGSGATTTTLPKGNPTQLVDEWATCMRSHGDPNQVDPTIDSNKDIHITFPPGVNGGLPDQRGGNSTNDPCGAYLTAASTDLRGGKPFPKPDPAKLEKFSQCMRAHGIPDFPDPNGGGLSLQTHPGSDLDPHNPTFKNASKFCAHKVGLQGILGTGTPPPGAIEAQSSGGPNGGPGGNGGAGAVKSVVGG